MELNRNGNQHRARIKKNLNAGQALIDLELERVLVVFVHVLIEYRPEFQQIRSVQMPFVSRQLDDFHVPFGDVRVQFHLVKFQMKSFDCDRGRERANQFVVQLSFWVRNRTLASAKRNALYFVKRFRPDCRPMASP